MAHEAMALASCTSDVRKIDLGKNDSKSENPKRHVKGLLCRLSNESVKPEIRVETHRLSDIAASILIGGQTSPVREKLLDPVFGRAQILKTDVHDAFKALLDTYGVTESYSKSDTFRFGQDRERHFVSARVRSLIGREIDPVHSTTYPWLAATDSLNRGVLPSGFKYAHGADCFGSHGPGDKCPKWNRFDSFPWRSMTLDDIRLFATRLKQLNESRRQTSSSSDHSKEVKARSQRYMNLIAAMFPSELPKDFLIMAGQIVSSCGPTGWRSTDELSWDLNYYARPVVVEALAVQNIADTSIEVTQLHGQRLQGGQPARVNLITARSMQPMSSFQRRLAPGERLIIPTRISFPARDIVIDGYSKFPTTQREIDAKEGPGKMRNAAGKFAIPDIRTYWWGPEIAVSGLTVNGQTIELPSRRRAQVGGDDLGDGTNEIDVTASAASGSCPYLLARDSDGGWIDYGKVLHLARGKRLEQTEEIILDGVQTHFRLEEREPEIAYVRSARLLLSLKDGRMLALEPDGNQFEGPRVAHLVWGDAKEFGFSLPAGVTTNDVASSKLLLTGFYRRYAQIVRVATPRASRHQTLWERDSRFLVHATSTRSGRACRLRSPWY